MDNIIEEIIKTPIETPDEPKMFKVVFDKGGKEYYDYVLCNSKKLARAELLRKYEGVKVKSIEEFLG